MNIAMPFFAAAIALAFHMQPTVETALILLAVSPVPPILPGKEAKAGGNVAYGVSLLALSALVSIVTVPLSVTLIGRLFHLDLAVPAASIAVVVAKSVLGPLVVGLVVQRVAPGLAARLAKPLSLVGTALLLLGVLPILVKMWPALAAQARPGAVIAIVLFTLLSLVVGHFLGGPADDDRTVLGLSTACRHPGVAMAIAGSILTAEQKPPVIAALFLCLVVGGIVTGPYAKRRRRAAAAGAPTP